jgi:hypothetical protein
MGGMLEVWMDGPGYDGNKPSEAGGFIFVTKPGGESNGYS